MVISNEILDLNQEGFFQNPYPFYQQMRLSGKPVWLEHKQQTLINKGVWLFSRYSDASMIFKSKHFSKSVQSHRAEGVATLFDLHLLHRDPPDHDRLRRLIAPYFSMQSMAQLQMRIDLICSELVSNLSKQSNVDLMSDFSELLPLYVIADMIGVPRTDMSKIRQWSIAIGNGFDSVIGSELVYKNQREALNEFLAYLQVIVKLKRNHPTNDIISSLTQANKQELLSDDELVAMVGFLLFSGHETTINLIGNALYLLLEHPAEWHKLKSDPDLLSSTIEEVLRYESPEQRTSFRVATSSMDISGHRVELGDHVGVIIGSANRDELEFEEAERFNISRAQNKHLAFGSGIHQCLGMHLARLEAKVAISAMVKNFPTVRLDGCPICWRKNSFFRGLQSIPASLI